MLPVNEQLAIIERSADQIVPRDELLKKLARGKPLRVKLGIDPTGFDVHLGHTVVLRKLRQFQELGHQIVLIIGTATAAVGDPSGRDASRQALTSEQIEKNAATYLSQIGKVVDLKNVEIVRNGDWFNKYDFAAMLRLLGQMTMQRMIERDDFTKRIKAGTPIYLHECLYPLMQGQDSVEVRADVEIGGTEQTFNLMAGRDLQRRAGQEPQICVVMPILLGLDGVKKMGKTAGNYIGVDETAYEQFAKTMSIPDDLMSNWFNMLTDRPKAEIESLLAGHPMVAKKALGQDVVRTYYGGAAANESQAEWERRFSARQDPTEIPGYDLAATELVDGRMLPNKLLVLVGFCKSNNEARQRITKGAMNLGPDKAKVEDPKSAIQVLDGLIVRLGSKKIVRIRIV